MVVLFSNGLDCLPSNVFLECAVHMERRASSERSVTSINDISKNRLDCDICWRNFDLANETECTQRGEEDRNLFP